MAVLALGGVMAATATAWMATQPVAGILLAILAFLAIGSGGRMRWDFTAGAVGDSGDAAAQTGGRYDCLGHDDPGIHIDLGDWRPIS
jgi:hypothetical protein